MDMREQMDAAWRGWRDRDETSSPEDRFGFELGFIAALNHIRNPSDEMVERCSVFVSKSTARALLKAAVGGE